MKIAELMEESPAAARERQQYANRDKLIGALTKKLEGYHFHAKSSPCGIAMSESGTAETEIGPLVDSKAVKALKAKVQAIADELKIGVRLQFASDDNELWIFIRKPEKITDDNR